MKKRLIFLIGLLFFSIQNVQAATLTDISTSFYKEAIVYLQSNGIVQGYPDQTYRPQASVNRAEFTKIVVGPVLGKEPAKPFQNCFPDVDKNQWFASWVCYAKEQGIIGGYPDGTFQPGGTINLAEASKILVNTLKVKLSSDNSGAWYETFIRSMQDQKYIPNTFTNVSQQVNRGQMAEMIYRILEELHDRPAKLFDFGTASLACLDNQVPANVDMNAVRNAWLKWHNDARLERNVDVLNLNTGLNYSASEWAKDNKLLGTITHTRPNGQSLTDWFTGLGIAFQPLSGVMYGENLGLRTYRCNATDCTPEAIETAKAIFDAFMAEEGTNYTGHYDNIVEPDFVELGLGIAIDTTEEIMYLTEHFSFGVKSYPEDLCV